MSDPSTYWLNVTNFLLGLVTLICIAAVAAGVVQEFAVRRRKRAVLANLDTEVANLFGDGHAFQTPALGLTMADGGEPLGGAAKSEPKGKSTE